MRKTVLLLASMAVALLLASGAGLLNAVKPAEATFPGQNGRIAYESFDILPGGAPAPRTIYTINPTGGTPVKLTNNDTGESDPSYLPNGKRIAYTVYDGNDSEIYTINATGGTPVQVTNNTRSESHPSYSPDGTKIAYSGFDGNDWEIYKINATGGTPVQLTNNDMHDTEPDYSPNGEKVAYTHCLIPAQQQDPDRSCADYHQTDEADYTEIFTINATGGTPFNVTNNNTYDASPSYSPNGNKIAYTHYDGNDTEIYKINATGGTPVQVTNSTMSDDSHPSYSPNGRKIAYAHYDGNDTEIYKIHHNGGTPVRVTNNNSYDVAPSWGSSP